MLLSTFYSRFCDSIHSVFPPKLLLLILISQRYESKTYLKKLKRLDWQIRQMNEIAFVNEHVPTPLRRNLLFSYVRQTWMKGIDNTLVIVRLERQIGNGTIEASKKIDASF